MLSYSARYLYQCIALLFCTLMACQIYAATVTYDFSAGSHTSEYGSNSSLTSTSGLSSFSHSGINAPSDGSYSSYSASRGNYPKMRYTFSVSENASDLTSITVTWSGYGYHSSGGQNGAILYIRNFSGGYEQLDTSNSSGYISLSGAVSSNLTNYVSGGQIQVLSVNRRQRQNRNHSSIHYTDYVKIDLETVTVTPIPDPEIEYRMDELLWQDSANEVVDNTGNNHDGQAKGGATTIEDGAICRAGEFDGSDDYVSAIDLSALRGTSSMSYWVKTSQLGSSVNYLAPGISGIEEAGGTDDIFWGWLDVSGNVGITVGDESTTKSSSSINNNVWRHVVLTRNAANGAYQIFIDGSLNASGTSTSGSISNSFSSIGRIEDNGGSPEYFDGQLDEVLIYDEVLSQTHVTQIYTNQSAGRNWDDAVNVRPCPVSVLPTPFAEYRFDEVSWSGVNGEILDNVGSNNGSIVDTGSGNVSNISDGKICRAGRVGQNTSASEQYAIDTNVDIDDEVGDTGTISFWYRSSAAWGSAGRKVLLSASTANPNNKYFFLTEETNGRLRFGLENTSDADYRYSSSSVFSFSSTDWVHLVVTWDMPSRKMQLFVNGNEEINATFASNQSIGEMLSLYLGDNRSSYIAGEGGISVNGDMDEVLIFKSVLTSAHVSTIYNNQNTGNTNYDGSARGSCPVAAIAPVADWRFDEASWSGTNDILDTSGNDYHGTAVNSSPSSDAQLCNSADLTLSGATDYLSMNKDAMNGLSDFTVIVWAKTTGTQDSTILSAASANSSLGANEAVMYFENNNRFWPSITSSPFDTNTKLSSSTASMRDGLWHQLVWTRDASTAQSCFLFDGVSQGCTTHTDGDDTSPLTVISNGLIIGQDQDSLTGGFDASQDWEGKLDEFLIFDTVLTQSQIGNIRTNIINSNNWDGTPRSCGAAVDHYSISHDATGVTCLLENITISAHDSGHNAVDAESKTVNLSTSSGKGDWIGVVSGATGLSNGAAGDGAASFTFSAGATSAVLTFAHPVLSGNSETFGFNVTNGSITEQSGSATIILDDPDITYSLAGFRFIDSSGATLIPTQISGKASNIAPDADTFYLQAVRASDSDPNVCVAALSGTKIVQLAAQCDNPSSCVSGQTFNVKSDSNPAVDVALNSAAPATPTSFSNVSMTFDGEAKAPLILNYSDAGQMQLHASFTVPETAATLTGASNQFVVRPFAFGFPSIIAGATSNPAGDETGPNATTGFVSAGSDFVASLNAYRYQSTDDSNSDGVPDAGANVTNNGVTPNFTGSVNIAVDSYTPSTGVAGTLSGDSVLLLDTYSNRSGANVPATLQYDEVGSVNLIATMDDYLSVGNADITSVSTKIGRFYPDHFAISGDSVTAACTPITDFTYMQQPFAQVQYTLEARPKGVTDSTGSNGRITQNYDEDDYASTALLNPAAENNNSGLDLSARVSAYSSVNGWQQGVYTVNRTDETMFSRDPDAAGKEDGPYASLQLGVSISSELDSRTFATAELDMKASDSNDCVADGDCDAASIGGAQLIRYGRMRIQSTHGPETEDLAIPFVTEYWDGNAFVTNLDDSCSQHPLSSISFDGTSIGPVVADRTVTVGDGSTVGSLNISGTNAAVATGDYSLVFSAPGAAASGSDNTGYFPVSVINIDDWLRYDWDQDGAANDASLPDAIVTFGRARGNDRMIFWQERYQ